MATYITRDGDTVDYVAWKYYGFQDRQTGEQMLSANPGLAEYGPELPHGITIQLPVLAAGTVAGTKLWD